MYPSAERRKVSRPFVLARVKLLDLAGKRSALVIIEKAKRAVLGEEEEPLTYRENKLCRREGATRVFVCGVNLVINAVLDGIINLLVAAAS